MKKEIPVPVIVLIVIAVVGLAAFFITQGIQGPPEFAGPKIEKTIPEHIFKTYSKADQDRLKSEGYKVVEAGQVPDSMRQNPYAGGAAPGGGAPAGAPAAGN